MNLGDLEDHKIAELEARANPILYIHIYELLLFERNIMMQCQNNFIRFYLFNLLWRK